MYSVVLMVALGTGGDLPACHRHRCHGCYGCYSYCGCYGGYGGCYGGYGGCYGTTSGCCAPATGQKAPAPQKKPQKQPQDGNNNSQVLNQSLRGMVVVSLPTDAKLTINDVATKATSATRRFVSPELAAGQTYVYHFKAEVVRDGKPVIVRKRVKVRAGAETRVRFEFPVTEVAFK
jgi:uncharacterized protein (TIGR03000 family)